MRAGNQTVDVLTLDNGRSIAPAGIFSGVVEASDALTTLLAADPAATTLPREAVKVVADRLEHLAGQVR
jgi:hypothetical protein